jgi:hypothetical protein
MSSSADCHNYKTASASLEKQLQSKAGLGIGIHYGLHLNRVEPPAFLFPLQSGNLTTSLTASFQIS